jgi:PPOX class probable F420-dependent enzyme
VSGPLPVEPGLCRDCRYAAVKDTRRGTTYLRCRRAEWDDRLVRYPALPVRRCPGYERWHSDAMSEPEAVLPPALRDWVGERHQAVLVTLRRDGSPQTSNIMYGYDEESGTFEVSVTDTRAKTRNLRRDPRGVLHVLSDSFWGYASISVRATMSEVSTEPGDATGQALLRLYERVGGTPHPDPEEFFQAMVTDRRLVLRLAPLSYSGSDLPS